MPNDRDRDLQIDENMQHQRLSWRAERVGWIVWTLILLAALLGLFGRGVFNTTSVTSSDARLTVEYSRFWRLQSPMTLRVAAGEDAVADGNLRLWLDRGYVDANTIASIVPEPDGVTAGADRLIFTFSVDAGAGRPSVTFEIEPQKAGFRAGRAGLAGSTDEVAFRQLIFP